MDEIRKLLEKCGLSADACNSICESLNKYAQGVHDQYEAEFQKKADQAKQICLEETENYKLNVAKRIQIFCEARVHAIERLIAKQSMLKESEAVETLEKMKSILEGISIADDAGVKRELAETRKQLTESKQKADKATQAATRQIKLANSVLKRNRLLETELISLKSTRTTVNEDTSGVDTRRGRQTPQTARRPIIEQNERRTAERPTDKANTMRNGMSPAEIAAQMQEE